MWVMLPNAFVSITQMGPERDKLMIQGRRRGDIERVFPQAVVHFDRRNDYPFRSTLWRTYVSTKIAAKVTDVDYGSFVASIGDEGLHRCYMHVWRDMAADLRT